jgi:RNA polymerase sigma factor (sigma-70 family)
MTYGPLNDVLRHIRRIALTKEAANLDDARLMERFLAQRDEAAFEALLRRHGPMVLGVCRRLLPDPHDTEDAFQATFLVLLRKAHSLRNRQLVANWLYGVAYRTALKARNQAARRRAGTRPLVEVPTEESESDVIWKDLRPVLDEEVQRLPDKYRVPVILCYLEGKTFQEAAQQLGCPAGTVSGRLARARGILRTRLTRRGLGLSAGLLGATLPQTAEAAVPGPLLNATVRAALTLTAKHAGIAYVIPASVALLMEGVLHGMFMTKIKTVATILLLAVMIGGGGAGVVSYQKLGAQPPTQHEVAKQGLVAPAQQERPEVQAERLGAIGLTLVTSDDDVDAMLNVLNVDLKMKSLLKERFDAAKKETEARGKEYEAGRGTLDIYLNSSRRLLEAELDLSTKTTDHVAAWRTHLLRMQGVYEINLARYNAGRISVQDLAQANYYRRDAEIGLERVKAKLKKSQSPE